MDRLCLLPLGCGYISVLHKLISTIFIFLVCVLSYNKSVYSCQQWDLLPLQAPPPLCQQWGHTVPVRHCRFPLTECNVREEQRYIEYTSLTPVNVKLFKGCRIVLLFLLTILQNVYNWFNALSDNQRIPSLKSFQLKVLLFHCLVGQMNKNGNVPTYHNFLSVYFLDSTYNMN